MMTVGRAFAQLRNWRHRRAAATGIVVGRRVEWDRAAFVVLLDLHFEYEGHSHQAQARVAAFEVESEAHAALLRWPIGSFRRLTFAPECPEAVSMA